jgi:hypothetical protein
MRLWLIALATAACTTPLQLESGAAFSRAGARPRLELSGGVLPQPVAIDRGKHEALWASAGSSAAITPDTAQIFVGPQLQLSRLRGFRTPDQALDAIHLRPEVGWSKFRGGTARFVGGSAGFIHESRGQPFTLSLRGGAFEGGPDSGFFITVGFGFVLGSSLWWMQ